MTEIHPDTRWPELPIYNVSDVHHKVTHLMLREILMYC